MRAFRLIWWLTIVITLSHCVQLIDFDLSDVNPEVVIYGVLTDNSQTTHWVNVSYSRGFGETITYIEDARIRVLDEEGGSTPYVFVPERSRYEPEVPGFHGMPGHAYQIEVDLGDKVYRSRPEQLPKTNVPENLDFNFTKRTLTSSQGVAIDQNVFEVYVEADVSDIPDPVHLRWEIEEVFIMQEVGLLSAVFPFFSPRNCYIPLLYAPAELALFSNEVNTRYRKRLIIEPVDEEFKGFHAFGIFQYAINPGAYQFWDDIDKASDRTPTIFEVPPGPVKGNLFNILDDRDQALGYFMVAKVDTSAVGTTESDIPFFVPGDTPPGGCDLAIAIQTDVPSMCIQCLLDRGVPEACIDCTTLPGSTRVRPDYLDFAEFPEDGP